MLSASEEFRYKIVSWTNQGGIVPVISSYLCCLPVFFSRSVNGYMVFVVYKMLPTHVLEIFRLGTDSRGV